MRRSLDQLPTHQATTDQPPGSGGRADCRASHSASGKSTRACPSCPDAETRSATIDHLVVRPPAWSQWGNDAVRREARKATWKWDAGTCSGAPGDLSSTTWERNSKPQPTLSVSSRRTDTTPSSLASITVFHTEHCTEHREVLKLPFHVPGTSLATPTPLGAFSVPAARTC